MLHPETAALLKLAAQRPGPRLRERTIAEARALSLASVKALDRLPVGMETVRDCVLPGSAPPINLRVYRPYGARSGEVLLFIHGGGWTVGDLESHDSLCRSLCADLGLRGVAVDYRLAPEHPFPAGYLDCQATLAWLSGEPPELDSWVTSIVLAGDSAGGNIAAGLSAVWAGPIAVQAQLLLYPAVDLSKPSPSYRIFGEGYLMEAADMDWFITAYTPDVATRCDPRASPLLGDLGSTPPTVIVTAGADVLRDEGRSYAAKLVAGGIETHFFEAKGFPHAWATSRGALPSSAAVLDRALQAVRSILAAARAPSANLWG
jgi:acetyl esterase